MAIDLIKMCIDAYVHLDLSNKKAMLDKENEIDVLFRQLYHELILIMIEDPLTIRQASSFIFVARYLERVGDHGINILESINYIVTGEYRDL